MFALTTSLAFRFPDIDVSLVVFSACAIVGTAFVSGFAQDAGKRASQALGGWLVRHLQKRSWLRRSGKRRIGF